MEGGALYPAAGPTCAAGAGGRTLVPTVQADLVEH